MKVVSRVFTVFFALIALLGLWAQAGQADEAQESKAQEMVTETIELYKTKGAEEAFAEINAKPEDYTAEDEDVYVFVVGPDDTVLVHTENPDYVGKKTTEVVDSKGANLGEAKRKAATAEGAWFEYDVTDPESEEVEHRKSWLVLYEDTIFGAAIEVDAIDEDDASSEGQTQGEEGDRSAEEASESEDAASAQSAEEASEGDSEEDADSQDAAEEETVPSDEDEGVDDGENGEQGQDQDEEDADHDAAQQEDDSQDEATQSEEGQNK